MNSIGTLTSIIIKFLILKNKYRKKYITLKICKIILFFVKKERIVYNRHDFFGHKNNT